jgi:hypothetical protein
LIQKKSSSHLLRSRDFTQLEPEINKLIEKSAEKLKQITIDKRVFKELCKPIYPSINWFSDEAELIPITERIIGEDRRLIEELESLIKKADDVYKEQSDFVNSVWQSDKLSIVPGDHVLDKICHEYDFRFNKDTDGPLLANYLTIDEIDTEIQAIIHEIGD